MKKPILLLLLVLFFSCKEETVSPTQGQLTAKKLAAELHASFNVASTSYSITVSAFESNTTLWTGSSLILTSDGFIKIVDESQNQAVFNLAFLRSYQVVGTNFKLVF